MSDVAETTTVVLHFPKNVDQIGAWNDVSRINGVRASRYKRQDRHIVATLVVKSHDEFRIRQQAESLEGVFVEP